MKSALYRLMSVQFSQEPAGRRPDPHAIDIAHIEIHRGCSKRVVLDEDTVDNGSDCICTISIDDSSHGLIEMGVLVIFTRLPCSFNDECDYVVDRRVGWIPRAFTNVVEGVGIGHEEHLVTVDILMRARRSSLETALTANLRESIFERRETVDCRGLTHNIVEKRSSLDSVGITLSCLDRIDDY